MTEAWTPERAAAVEKAFWEFASRVRINSKEQGGNYRLIDGLYTSQKRFVAAVFRALGQNKHDIKCLKSRQLGITTICEVLDDFWLGIHPGMSGALIYDTNTHKDSGRERIKFMTDHLPRSFKFPRVKRYNRDGMTLENESRLLFLSAGVRQSNASGVLGRSEGLNFWHRSELRSYENEEGLKSLLSTRSNIYRDRLYIDESTGSSYGSAWYEIWSAAKNDEDAECIFVGWWSKDDQRWPKGTPRYEKYGLDPPTDEEMRRITTVKELYDFEIDDEQLAWYRWFVDPTRDREEDDAEDSYLLSDQPWTEDEAFQQAGSTFFQSDRLQQSAAYATTQRFQTFRFWPGTTIVDSDIRPARYLREIELKLWEEPLDEAVYAVGGDAAFGHNEENNNSCAEVIRCYADGWDQVAEFTSSTIEPHHFAWLLLSLTSYYAQPAQNIVMPIIELNGPGEEVWRQFHEMIRIIRDGYLKAPARERGIGNVGGNIRNYIYTKSDSMRFGSALHFRTHQQLKVQMMEGFRNNFHNRIAVVRSLDAIEEMKTITRNGDKIGAARQNGRDDRNFALALANRAWSDSLRRILIGQNRTREADRISRTHNVVDRVALFNKNMLGEFFKVKDRQRLQMRVAARQRSRW